MKSIVLLSGGLDSLVSLAIEKQKNEIAYALFFDYGQKSVEQEFKASNNIANFYNIPLKLVNIDFMKELEYSKDTDWVPNRNALFVNIAASFADAENLDYIILGANCEEAEKFSDNSIEFVEAINNTLNISTQNHVKLLTPLISMDKDLIVKKAIELNAPLKLIYSCYNNKENHCGICNSCKLLKQALINNNQENLIKTLFEE